MSGTIKEKGDACNNKEDEQHITCTDDMKQFTHHMYRSHVHQRS